MFGTFDQVVHALRGMSDQEHATDVHGGQYRNPPWHSPALGLC
jgi:hypothetical protein